MAIDAVRAALRDGRALRRSDLRDALHRHGIDADAAALQAIWSQAAKAAGLRLLPDGRLVSTAALVDDLPVTCRPMARGPHGVSVARFGAAATALARMPGWRRIPVWFDGTDRMATIRPGMLHVPLRPQEQPSAEEVLVLQPGPEGLLAWCATPDEAAGQRAATHLARAVQALWRAGSAPSVLDVELATIVAAGPPRRPTLPTDELLEHMGHRLTGTPTARSPLVSRSRWRHRASPDR